MTNIVYDALSRNLRLGRTTPSGWQNLIPVCCSHRGHYVRPNERRTRAGIKWDADGVVYNCHNCQFVAKWSEGYLLSRNMERLLEWSGMSSDEIRDLKFLVAQERYYAQYGRPVLYPDGLKTVQAWIDENSTDMRLLKIAEFLLNAEPPEDLNKFWWTPDDNGCAMDGYIVQLMGNPDQPRGWAAFPYLDPSQPYRTHEGVEPDTEDEIPAETLAEMERLMSEHPNGSDEPMTLKPLPGQEQS